MLQRWIDSNYADSDYIFFIGGGDVFKMLCKLQAIINIPFARVYTIYNISIYVKPLILDVPMPMPNVP